MTSTHQAAIVVELYRGEDIHSSSRGKPKNEREERQLLPVRENGRDEDASDGDRKSSSSSNAAQIDRNR